MHLVLLEAGSTQPSDQNNRPISTSLLQHPGCCRWGIILPGTKDVYPLSSLPRTSYVFARARAEQREFPGV